MFRRHWPAFAIVAALMAVGLNVQAQPPAKTPAPTSPAPVEANIKDLVARQQELEKRYKAFTTNLLALALKLEKSERIEDKDKAKALKKAIELADKEGVDNKFTTLLRTLTKSADISISDIGAAKNQNDDLVKVLRSILDILQSDDELARIKAEKELLEKLLADLNGLIRQTNINQSRADSGRGDPKQLAKDQKRLADEVDRLAEKMGDKKSKDGAGKPKDGSPKDGSPKDGSPKDGSPKDGSPKDGSPKDGSPKDGSPKDGKPSDGKPKDGKPSDGKPKDGKPMDGSPMDGAPKDGAPKDGQASNSPPMPKAPGAESVRRAVQDEENAAKNLDEDKRPKASEDLTKAEEELKKAKEDLEKRLKQLREQELERLLANLEARVNKMLTMQKEVQSATKAINETVQKHPEKKAQPADFQNSQKQEDKEAEIIHEADKAIQLLQSEGSAVAFPAVFEEVRKDMSRVKERLHDANVGEQTIALEQDIIDSLEHMRDALKKAQQEIGKSPPMPPGMPPPDQPQLQKLLDEIAELKMIRELQKQVNRRTERNGMTEQSEDPQTRKELKDLSDRQEKIETMVNNLATKKNQ